MLEKVATPSDIADLSSDLKLALAFIRLLIATHKCYPRFGSREALAAATTGIQPAQLPYRSFSKIAYATRKFSLAAVSR